MNGITGLHFTDIARLLLDNDSSTLCDTHHRRLLDRPWNHGSLYGRTERGPPTQDRRRWLGFSSRRQFEIRCRRSALGHVFGRAPPRGQGPPNATDRKGAEELEQFKKRVSFERSTLDSRCFSPRAHNWMVRRNSPSRVFHVARLMFGQLLRSLHRNNVRVPKLYRQRRHTCSGLLLLQLLLYRLRRMRGLRDLHLRT
jgi:hypothetical protein